jgi:hypothetical protein
MGFQEGRMNDSFLIVYESLMHDVTESVALLYNLYEHGVKQCFMSRMADNEFTYDDFNTYENAVEIILQ